VSCENLYVWVTYSLRFFKLAVIPQSSSPASAGLLAFNSCVLTVLPMMPTLVTERRLLRSHRAVIAFDEVGRGALAGPVCVGAVALCSPLTKFPEGLADSKVLSASRRAAMVAELETWVRAWAVGVATSREVDRYGILGAQARAADRALKSVVLSLGVELEDCAALVDGGYDWLRRPYTKAISHKMAAVELVIRGDGSCASLAAASVLAKVSRDRTMDRLARKWNMYGWDKNKGYGSLAHRRAIVEYGVSPEHRVSWNLGIYDMVA
jgi:ribonuclease HII